MRPRLATGVPPRRVGAPGRRSAWGPDARAGAVMSRPTLRPCLEDQIERRLGRAADAGEPRLLEHLAQPSLAGLCAEREADLLRERRRRADERRDRVEDAPDRVQVVLDAVVRE